MIKYQFEIAIRTGRDAKRFHQLWGRFLSLCECDASEDSAVQVYSIAGPSIEHKVITLWSAVMANTFRDMFHDYIGRPASRLHRKQIDSAAAL